MGFVGALHSLRSFRRRLPWALDRTNKHRIDMTNSYTAQSEEAESKYIYFIMGASAAALAYALEHGQEPALGLRYALYLSSVLSWLSSFYLGLRAVQFRLSSINIMANAEQFSEQMQLARKNLSAQLLSKLENEYLAAIESGNNALATQACKFQIYNDWQFRLIAFGAMFYTGWKLLPLATP
jgi:hypothetical protein